jgi:ABC-2 type transport system ATP-binding protein
MEQTMIQIENVHATYGHGARTVHALRDVNLSVQAGEIFGLLGPNGAGKTTLLACLEGLHRPERGLVMVNGLDVTREPDRVKRQLGIQLQRTALMDDLTAGELMQAYAAMYEIFPGKAEIRARLAQFGLAEQVRVFPRRMSGGQQQRLALALALVNDRL